MSDKWFQYATPESVGISSAAIEKLIDTMCQHTDDQETHGFTIIRHKKIVAEGFFAPFQDEPHVIQSCSKAFTAAAIGFAAQEELLSLDDPVAKYLPEYLPENPDPRALKITIRQLMYMADGHAVKVFAYPNFEIAPAQLKRDFFAAPFKCDSGIEFKYENTDPYILSAVIKKATGMDMMDYLRPRFLDKLKINPHFLTDDEGMSVGYSTLRMRQEELARFGQCYMDGGVWEGERLLSEEWVRDATSKHIDSINPNRVEKDDDWEQGYAYLMWRGQYNSFRFCGAYGQICACYPDYDLMICLNSGHTQVVQDELDCFYEHILTKLEDSLPENPEALESLRRRCVSLSLPQKYSPPSPMVPKVNGKTYEAEGDEYVKSAQLTFADDICHVTLNLVGGDKFEVDAGLKDFAKTDFTETTLNDFLPKDNGVSAATGYWRQLNEFCVDGHVLPTPTIFHLTFCFMDGKLQFRQKVVRGRPIGAKFSHAQYHPYHT